MEHTDDCIYKNSYKMLTMIVNEQEKEILKAIERYCEENNVFPNIIDEDKLKIALKLGREEAIKRDLI